MSAQRRRRPGITPTPAAVENGKPDLEAQNEWLAAQLQDAHLVIGRQQVALLRAEQTVLQLQQQLAEQQTGE